METIVKKEDGSFEYGTLQEAERRKKVALDSREGIFCVLKDGFCRVDCGCFEKPRIVNNGPEEHPLYECLGGYCTAYALVGPT